ncbi:hypothetical protein VOLCADRAFT_119365 [Volvox carteri f. nagariensis]|uniref:Glyoxysomal processing protease, glyoxysomal n=1 Tax=Volvox carteri f. nagariensis TaxID=3068 RepID=D8UCH5_VOLCA|nr:uncharacterized protein VOLCADRAFT_119365 [Volvox carteri f. nagariensis]EFJ42493.1 hypothetical protein VOLCADRAFT_119365 [Volvox carteri f. nagariensis]|eukprot:XP_002956349.1 hypothetical protein VOLCADRAFT_119365 [Volvox carteri f. nagariensis]
MAMRFTPLLVLVSGDARNAEQHDSPLAFTTTTRGLHFTSCSGLLLAKGDSHDGIVLVPAAVLRHWMKPGAGWLASSCGAEPPALTPDCAICAVGPASALSDGAATCIPIATVQVPALSRAAAYLLQSLNRGESSAKWAFEWNIGGPCSTAAEQGSFVLCWAQPLRAAAAACTNRGNAGAPAPGSSSGPAAGQLLPDHLRDAALCHNGSGATVSDLGPLIDPACVALLRSFYFSLSATPAASPRWPTSVMSPQRGAAFAACAASPRVPPSSSSKCAGTAACTCTCTGAAPGRLVSVTGSPFGCLAPFHFANATINGAVACAFPAPLDTPTAAGGGNTTTVGATAAAAAAADPCGCGLGPALYVLDAHVFPGMEGAPVTLQEPPLQQSLTAPTAPGAADGGSIDSIALLPEPPLALLCTPISRRADGVQMPLAAAWSHVAAALKGVLAQLLLQALGPSAVDSTALIAHLTATTDAVKAGKQQLQLQPVAASRIVPQGATTAVTRGCGGGWRHSVRPECGSGGSSGCRGGGGGQAQPPSGRLWGGAGGSAYRPEAGEDVLGDWAEVGDSAAATWPNGGGEVTAVTVPPVTAMSCCSGAVTRAVAAGSPAVATISTSPSGRCPTPTTANSHTAAGASAALLQPLAAAPTLAAAGVELPPWVLQAVVLLRCNGSWATGVVVEGRSGLFITTAHLFQRPPHTNAAGGPSQLHGKRGGAGGSAGSSSGDVWTHLQCWARVPWVSDSGGGGDTRKPAGRAGLAYRWMRARVLYIWSNHLDLAVLQLEPSYGSSWAAESMAAALVAVHETAHARVDSELEACVFRRFSAPVPVAVAEVTEPQCAASDGCRNLDVAGAESRELYGPGSPVWAVGHSLVGPAAEWPALVSYGCIARVVRVRSGRPTMIIATTTTHAGGSGGALLDARGRLVGLVTSNARHAGVTTLPNMAFCIAAEELEPVIRWAAAQGCWGTQTTADTAKPTPAAAAAAAAAGPMARAAKDMVMSSAPFPPRCGWAALEALDEDDPDAARIWRLQMPSLERVLAPVGLAAAAAASGISEPLLAAAQRAAAIAAARARGGGSLEVGAVHPSSTGVWSRL